MDEKDKITYFAETDARNKRVRFGIKAEDRLRHVYSIGKTGMGKSTMLENMAIQDIQNGEGMAFLDPHGKTADLLLDYIPEHRIKDVIYFAPFDTDFPISFNVMEDVGPERRHLVVSGLMSAFEKIWEDQWSSRMAYILQNTLAALLEYPGATMLSINRMLTDKTYRQKVVDNVKDPTTKSFWVDEFAKYTDKYAAEATPAIQNKVGQFVSNPLIRNIVGQAKSSFDIRKIMDEKKILIVNLSKGLVGEGNANLLGAMLVTKIYLAAMSRADVTPAELKKLSNFYLYVDEFQSFANKSFADILSEARKYKLSLNITHQYIEQMAEEVKAAVFGNVGTMIAFRVGSYDAEILEKEFAPVFTMEDIVNLGLYQVYLKLMIDGVASQPFSAVGLPPFPKPEISFRDEVMKMSRMNFAGSKEKVEQDIKEWHQPDSLTAKSLRAGTSEKIEAPARYASQGEAGGRSTKHEIRNEPRKEETKRGLNINEVKSETKKIEPKFEHKPEPAKENHLAKALAEVIKPKPKAEQEKETILLVELKHGNKNKNGKEPSIQNVNALKEAISKVASSQQLVAREEKTPPNPPLDQGREKEISNQKTKEIPEETLRKILKGE